MLILAADTSGKNGSIAVVRFEAGKPRTLDLIPLEGGTFSAQLVPQIAAALKTHSLKKEEIDAFAVASGPGSFTGLRVGLAAIKALAEVLRKPIAPVSLLEAVARAVAVPGRILAALDAGRGDVYVGLYEIKPEADIPSQILQSRLDMGQPGKCTSACMAEQLLTIPDLLTVTEPVVTPDAKLAAALRAANRPVTFVRMPQADAIARLGYEKLQSGQVISPEALDATYIRRSDAEIMKSRSSPK